MTDRIFEELSQHPKLYVIGLGIGLLLLIIKWLMHFKKWQLEIKKLNLEIEGLKPTPQPQQEPVYDSQATQIETIRPAPAPKPAPAPALRTVSPGRYRWIVLVFMSLAMFGNFYVYDGIGALHEIFRTALGFSEENLDTLYTIYSIPNLFMVLIGGIIVDRVGVRRATMLFGSLCLMGAVITALTGNFTVMAAGRLVFGVGAESLIISVMVTLAKWFKGKELAFAIGVNLFIARLGTYLALRANDWGDFGSGSWQLLLIISACVGTLCVIGPIMYWSLENRVTKRTERSTTTSSGIVKYSDLFRLGKNYWLIILLCVTFYSAKYSFQSIASPFYREAYMASNEYIGSLYAIMAYIPMFGVLIAGYFIDRLRKRAIFMMLGSLLLLPAFLLMTHTYVPLRFPAIMLGLAYSLVQAALWPLVAYVVDESKLGTAYGLMTMIQNLGVGGGIIIVNGANKFANAGADNPGGYALAMWIFAVLGVISFVLSAFLKKADVSAKGARY